MQIDMRNQINKTVNTILKKSYTSITLSKYKDTYHLLLSKGFPHNCRLHNYIHVITN